MKKQPIYYVLSALLLVFGACAHEENRTNNPQKGSGETEATDPQKLQGAKTTRTKVLVRTPHRITNYDSSLEYRLKPLYQDRV